MSDAPTVLIIDDDPAVARAFALALAREGFRARAVNSAEEALQELHAHPPDAIILDFRMPRINGVGFLYRLRAQAAYCHTPVVVITGDLMLTDEIREELRELGAEIKLKPVAIQELVATTRLLLSRAAKPAPGRPNISPRP